MGTQDNRLLQESRLEIKLASTRVVLVEIESTYLIECI